MPAAKRPQQRPQLSPPSGCAHREQGARCTRLLHCCLCCSPLRLTGGAIHLTGSTTRMMFMPPRYCAGAISDRYRGTTWLAQPMPKPRKMRPAMSMPRFWAEALRAEPSRNLRRRRQGGGGGVQGRAAAEVASGKSSSHPVHAAGHRSAAAHKLGEEPASPARHAAQPAGQLCPACSPQASNKHGHLAPLVAGEEGGQGRHDEGGEEQAAGQGRGGRGGVLSSKSCEGRGFWAMLCCRAACMPRPGRRAANVPQPHHSCWRAGRQAGRPVRTHHPPPPAHPTRERELTWR